MFPEPKDPLHPTLNDLSEDVHPDERMFSVMGLFAGLIAQFLPYMILPAVVGVLVALMLGFTLSLMVILLGGLILFEARRRGATLRNLSAGERLGALGFIDLFLGTLAVTVYAEWLGWRSTSHAVVWYQAALGLLLLLTLAYVALRVFWSRKKPLEAEASSESERH